ncbi:hypothetical protein OFN61_36820, partial [Escherichia coli]|nr:hypothetical protein [Escherichia coli]
SHLARKPLSQGSEGLFVSVPIGGSELLVYYMTACVVSKCFNRSFSSAKARFFHQSPIGDEDHQK